MMVLSAAAAVVAAGAAVHGSYHRNSPLFGRALGALPGGERNIALTFDDGPNPVATPRILDTLEREQIPATFFILGRHADRWPALACRAASAGHQLGNHGYFHRTLHRRGPGYARHDLVLGTDAIERATGRRPTFFRAPHGFRAPWVTPIARTLGQQTVGWSLGVWDSARPGVEQIVRRTLDGVRPGCILLLHDGDGDDPAGDRTQTAQALPLIIDALRQCGYTFRTLPM
ncbi:MAG TPA: polysaccharide deacetylase family protein [Gemmatimonadaceae bacterium]|nr:polysaccharide deacetylase family protein [Gemmatimonadaceae bacterium]